MQLTAIQRPHTFVGVGRAFTTCARASHVDLCWSASLGMAHHTADVRFTRTNILRKQRSCIGRFRAIVCHSVLQPFWDWNANSMFEIRWMGHSYQPICVNL